jgi:type I restriction enzyme S subunit
VSVACETKNPLTAQKWRPYPEYKNSGIEWLCDIPLDWQVHKLGSKCSVKARLGWKGLKAAEYVDNGYIFLATPNIKERDIDFENVDHITPNRYFESPEIMLRVGDVLVAKDGATLGITNLVRKLPAPATVNGSIAVLRPKPGLDSSFLCYWLSSDYSQQVIQRMKGGMGVPHLFQADLRKFIVSCPALNEQIAIAAFLDRETAKIDALIAKREELIALLEEKRAALISRAATKGLDPNVPMKRSGVEWLGDIPAHWEMKRLKHLAESLQTGPFGTQLHADEYIEDGIPVINPANLERGTIIPDWKCTVNRSVFHRLRHHRLEEGNIVFARRGEMGRCALVTQKEDGWLCGTGCLRVRLDIRRSYPPFINLLLSTKWAKDWFMLESVGTTMENLNTEIIGAIPLAVTTLEEQRRIAEEVATLSPKIDAITTKNREAIETLQEYRTALISAAVTGKIDVRGEVQ